MRPRNIAFNRGKPPNTLVAGAPNEACQIVSILNDYVASEGQCERSEAAIFRVVAILVYASEIITLTTERLVLLNRTPMKVPISQPR